MSHNMLGLLRTYCCAHGLVQKSFCETTAIDSLAELVGKRGLCKAEASSLNLEAEWLSTFRAPDSLHIPARTVQGIAGLLLRASLLRCFASTKAVVSENSV